MTASCASPTRWKEPRWTVAAARPPGSCDATTSPVSWHGTRSQTPTSTRGVSSRHSITFGQPRTTPPARRHAHTSSSSRGQTRGNSAQLVVARTTAVGKASTSRTSTSSTLIERSKLGSPQPSVTIAQDRLHHCSDRSSPPSEIWRPVGLASADPGAPVAREVSAHRPQIDADLGVEDQERFSVDVELLRGERREALDIVALDAVVRSVVLGKSLDGGQQVPVEVREPRRQRGEAVDHLLIGVAPAELLLEGAERIDIRLLDLTDLTAQFAKREGHPARAEGQVVVAEDADELVPEDLVLLEVRGREMLSKERVHVPSAFPVELACVTAEQRDRISQDRPHLCANAPRVARATGSWRSVWKMRSVPVVVQSESGFRTEERRCSGLRTHITCTRERGTSRIAPVLSSTSAGPMTASTQMTRSLMGW